MAKNYICHDGMKPGTAYSKNSLDFFENFKYNLSLEAKAPSSFYLTRNLKNSLIFFSACKIVGITVYKNLK